MINAIVRKNRNNWYISNLQGMAETEANSVFDKIQQEPGFHPGLQIDITTRGKVFGISGGDLSNDSTRLLIISHIGGN